MRKAQVVIGPVFKANVRSVTPVETDVSDESLKSHETRAFKSGLPS
jgi:hypothetical protein